MSETAADLVTRYARAGFAVMPLHWPEDGRCSCGHDDCASPAKHPMLKHGVHDATTDLGKISEWLARWPSANWAITPPDGIVVLDVDPRNDGDGTLADLEAHNDFLPETLTCTTGSGGWHFWFRYDGPSRGKLAKGIDVKKAGGYLVVPPSLHMAGGRYEWTNLASLAYAPWWVRQLLNPPPPAKRLTLDQPRGDSLGGLVRFVQESPEGQRNSRLYWAACRAHGAGHDVAALLQVGEEIGLTRHEVEATVRSAGHAPVRTETPLNDQGRRRGA